MDGEESFRANTDRGSAASLFAFSNLSSFHPLGCKSSSTSRSEQCAACERRALCQDSRLPRGLPLELVFAPHSRRSLFSYTACKAPQTRCSLYGPALLQVPGAQQSLQGLNIATSVPEDARSTDAEKRPSWTAALGSVQCRSQKANNEAAEHRPLCAVYRIAKFQQKLVHNPRQLEYACCWEKQRPATRFHHGTRKRALSCTFTAAKCMRLKISEKHTSEERGLESECCRTQLSALTEQRPAGSSQPCPDLTLAVTSYPGKCPCGHWGCVLPVSPPNPCAPAAPGWQRARSCKLLHSEQALLSDH